MALPTIVYIDDNPRDARLFQVALKKHLKIIFIQPIESIDSLLEQAFSHNPDAVIVDFRLSDLLNNVHYDGYQVVSNILDYKDRFPVFILTSNQNDAFVEVDDVNYVYEKSQMHTPAFAERVVRQIAKHKEKLYTSEVRILELLKKSQNEKLTIEEEKELIKLDSFIEKSFDKQSAVPQELKTVSNEKQVSAMLREVDELIAEVKKTLPNQ